MTTQKIATNDLDVSAYDPAELLDSPQAIAAYVEAALEENDPDFFMAALNNVVRAHGIAAMAQQAGVGRESLYKSLAPGATPRFETILKLLKALGLRLVPVPLAQPQAEPLRRGKTTKAATGNKRKSTTRNQASNTP